MAEMYPGRLILGLDAREGKVAAEGWLETSTVDAVDAGPAIRSICRWPGSFTPTSRVTARWRVPTWRPRETLAECVTDTRDRLGRRGQLEDLERLAALPIAGCIVGRALYEGRFTLAEAIGVEPDIGPHRLTACPYASTRPDLSAHRSDRRAPS